MQRLTGMDATFLYTETPSSHMHVTGVSVFDPSTVPGGYDFAKVRDLVENRLQLLPPFRRRLLEIPFALHHPLWIEDPDFDLDYHIRRAALPSPGGDRELAEFAADVNSRPLDRRRPLWEMYVIEGLENGFIATVTKTHHAAIDGVSGAELTVNLLDLEPEPMVLPPQDPPWQPDKIPSDAELVGFALSSLARQPIAAVKAARRTAEMAIGLRRRNREPGITPPPSPFSAPHTSINVNITPRRRVAFTEVSLDDVKMVKNALGGTVNDVVLAMCSGALRRFFADRDEQPDGSLVGMVPISVRTEEQKGTYGNRVSSMFVDLHSDIDDPVKRLHAIGDGTKNAKEQEKAYSAEALTDWTEFAAPAVAARAFRLLSSTRIMERLRPIFNVTISNVPGPNFPLYSAGARMIAMYPLGPILDGGAVNITCMSYMGSMFFGLNADHEALPDVDKLAGYINDALGELLKAASSPAKSSKSKSAAAKKA